MTTAPRRSGYRARTRREAATGAVHLDLGGDHRSTVFLAGSGRSGTTWLSDVINSNGDFRYIFEPFHPEKVPLCKHFLRKQYLAPDEDPVGHLEAVRKVLGGDVRGGWPDRFNRKFLARRRLVKDIRANLMLAFIHARFPGMPVVLMLRHPCAVTDSRLRLGWRDNLPEVMSQRRLVEDHLRPFEDEISGATDEFERGVYLWCVENYVPLTQLTGQIRRGEVHLVRYEDLLTDPPEELESLFWYLGMEVPDGLIRDFGGLPREELISGWTERVSPAQRRRTAEILRRFGLDGLYGEDGLPSGATGVRGRSGG